MPAPDEQPGPYKRDVADVSEPAEPQQEVATKSEAPVTKVLLAVNILIFAVMALASSGQSLGSADRELMLKWGADWGPLTLGAQQYWRLVSNAFLHWDVLHLAFNMYALWNLGVAVERYFGSSKMLVMYLFAAVGGSLASLYFHPEVTSAGASGAVFGAFGSLLAFLRFHAAKFDKTFVKSATQSIVVLLVVNLLWGFSRPGIDNFAHIGGFLTGVVAGLCCVTSDHRSTKWTAGNCVWLLLLGAALLFALQFDLNSFDIRQYRIHD
jgi:rhomboid protease GluP